MALGRLTTLVAAGVALAGAAAQAGTIVVTGPGVAGGTLTATSAAGATSSPFPLLAPGNAGTNGFVTSNNVNFNGGTITFSPDATQPLGGVYDGNVTNVSASPFNGTSITPTNYLVAQPGDPVTIDFTTVRNTFSLLWGTVDSFNSLSLDFRNDGLDLFRLTITGTQVATAVNAGATPGSPNATFAANGTTSAFVSLFDLPGFNEIIATSTQSAFEFEPSLVPEPASLALLGAGLAGMGVLRRRRGVRAA